MEHRKLERWEKWMVGCLMLMFCVFVLMIYWVIYLAPPTPQATIRIDNIVRVFMHQPSEFTVMIKSPNSTKIDLRFIRAGGLQFIADVPPDKDSWVEISGEKKSDYDEKKLENYLCYYNSSVKFHIHSPKDVEGGGWEREEGSVVARRRITGQTNVIE